MLGGRGRAQKGFLTLWTTPFGGFHAGEWEPHVDYPKFSSFEVQVTIGEGKSAVAGAEPPLRGNPIARAPSSVWSRLVDHTERREAGDTQDTQEEEEEEEEEEEKD